MFVFEHIYDIMCLPTKLMYTIAGHTKPTFQIAMNTFAFNVSYSLLQVFIACDVAFI